LEIGKKIITNIVLDNGNASVTMMHGRGAGVLGSERI
jgi:hypothetical protein